MSNSNALGKPFTNAEVSSFCGQLALILKSGISSIEGIAIMMEDAQSKEEKAILESIYENIQYSGSLYSSLSESGLFPKYMLNMVQIGEQTGTLDDVMEALKSHYDREDSVAKSIRNAIVYPVVMGAMMVAVIVVLLVKVMPIFNQVFAQLGAEMSGFSKALSNIGSAISNYSIVFVVIIALFMLFAIIAVKTSFGKKMVRSIGYKLPGTRKMYENTAACRFASGMSLTLKSGMDINQALELTETLNEDFKFSAKISDCRKYLDEGMSLHEAINKANIFSGVYARMISIGARTGSMDHVMDDVATLYKDEVDNRMNNVLAILEPTLVIALSLIVGVILLSVMLPLMGIMSGI